MSEVLLWNHMNSGALFTIVASSITFTSTTTPLTAPSNPARYLSNPLPLPTPYLLLLINLRHILRHDGRHRRCQARRARRRRAAGPTTRGRRPRR
ncbi:unnamed protein product [Zymoseptoria tritici ST99CH_3D7]|uniref:Uncharacterized protein n=1 Tax=Zymoseptoria tritici (strain ST99CH_3D7) TaxID=1276538 RepID=A0A1X7S7D4_ZYMT9|nr:unnamed protein product [Zymoseptoria tritici ST99CH_3D7]